MTASDDREVLRLLRSLTTGSPKARLAAARSLGDWSPSHLGIVQALEKAAAGDPEPAVCEAALAALQAPQHQSAQASRLQRTPMEKRLIIQEIERWLNEGLLPPSLARVLALRYTAPAASAKRPPPSAPARPKYSLVQALLSEAAARIALYLGAFFVLAAAFILAAIVEIARIPILVLLILAFFGGAVGLRRRIPQASYVLFAAGTFMIPILAGVLRDRLPPGSSTTLWFWSATTAVMAACWGLGTWTHRSRAFSVLAFLATSISMVLLGQWTEAPGHLTLLFLEVVLLGGLGAVGLLRASRRGPSGEPLFITAQVAQVAVLGVSILTLLVETVLGRFPGRMWWVVLASTWFLASAFYVLSHSLRRMAAFALMAVLALLPVPVLLLEVAELPSLLVRWIHLAWGALLGLAGGAAAGPRWPAARPYAPFLVAGSFFPLVLAAMVIAADDGWWGVAAFAAAAALYLGLTAWRRWWTVWTAGLACALITYLLAFADGALDLGDSSLGWILLMACVGLLGVDLVAHRRKGPSRRWSWPPRVLGVGFSAITAVIATISQIEEPSRWTFILLGLGVAFVIYAQVLERPAVGYATVICAALALPGVLTLAQVEIGTLAYAVLGVLVYAAGLALGRLPHARGWPPILTTGGLAIGALASLGALLEQETASVVAVGLTAGLCVVEGVRVRDVRMAVPANLLFAEAYLLALMGLEVTEPQVYSIGVALLGILTHYAFLRAGANTGAMIAGILAQLLLLSTTYIQMLLTERFVFFFILFFQTLALLVYGLVVRARSFVLVPIPFSILGVITVAFSLLSGLSTAVVIGCSGVLLLILGILALLLRERLARLTDRLGQSLGGWRG